jgi:polyhydroxyalkanoate synthesis repressor PhaR
MCCSASKSAHDIYKLLTAWPRRIVLQSKSTSNAKSSSKSNDQGVPRVIKKYPNRRLYDTNSSAYITLAEVKQLVIDGQTFVVRDAKTNDDLTRSILLQIILEEESGGLPMFSEAALANMIRFYGNTMQGFMGTYLEKNVQAFSDIQAKMTEQGKVFAAGVPGLGNGLPSAANMPPIPGMVGSYVEQSHTMFTQMQEQMQKQTEQMFAAFGMKR